MKTIKVLLLDDMSEDFSKLKKIITEISKDLLNNGIKLELLYDYDGALILIENFVAYKTMPLHLQDPARKVVFEMVEQIKKETDLICVIDIVWAGGLDRKKSDQYGCDFYSEFLNDSKRNQNTVITTVIQKTNIPNPIGTLKTVCKMQNRKPFGDIFKAKLTEIICEFPIVENYKENRDGDIKPHTEK